MARRFHIRTFGCQMNEHDSERLAGMLRADGLEATDDPEAADVIVLNTCCIRENADNKLYGHLGHLKALKQRRPDVQIAVGGCLAQKDRGDIVERAAHVDVVFGTHNLAHAAGAARACPAQQDCTDRDRRGTAGIPVGVACRPRIRIRRLGFHLGRLQQQLHVLHRAGAARQGSRPQPG